MIQVLKLFSSDSSSLVCLDGTWVPQPPHLWTSVAPGLGPWATTPCSREKMAPCWGNSDDPPWWRCAPRYGGMVDDQTCCHMLPYRNRSNICSHANCGYFKKNVANNRHIRGTCDRIHVLEDCYRSPSDPSIWAVNRPTGTRLWRGAHHFRIISCMYAIVWWWINNNHPIRG